MTLSKDTKIDGPMALFFSCMPGGHLKIVLELEVPGTSLPARAVMKWPTMRHSTRMGSRGKAGIRRSSALPRVTGLALAGLQRPGYSWVPSA